MRCTEPASAHAACYGSRRRLAMTEPGSETGRQLLAAQLALVVAVNAAGAMIVEIVAGRMLAPYFGMSITTWTTIIGVVLTGLAIGHWAGGRVADAHPRNRAAALGLACLAGAVTNVLILPLVNIVAGSLAAAGVSLSTAIVVTGFAAFLLPSLAAGLVQPIATTLGLEVLGTGAGRLVGRMLAAGVVGAILGTFAAGFVLIAYLGSAGSIWLVAALNALLGALLLTTRRLRALCLGLLVIALGCAATGTTPPGFAAPCDQESRYFCISVIPGERLGLPGSRALRIDALTHSVNHPDPNYLHFSHLQWVDELVRRRFAGRIFSSYFVGGGGFTLPRAWIARHPANEVVVAELDPAVTAVAAAQLWFEPGPATRILHTDARVALERELADASFDVIVGDAFRDLAMPAHLITSEFHALVANRLAPGGFYVLNVIDRVTSKRLVASVVRTLRRHFAEVEVWYEMGEYQTSTYANFIIYGAARATGLSAPFDATTAPATRWARLEPGSLATVADAIVLSDDHAPVERLLRRD